MSPARSVSSSGPRSARASETAPLCARRWYPDFMLRSALRSLCLLTPLLALGACVSTHSVRLNVEHADADGSIRPLEGALVRAIPMNASPAPLPVSVENLSAYRSVEASRPVAVVDASGRVELRLAVALPHRIEVLPPAWTRADDPQPPRAWRLAPGARSLRPLPAGVDHAPIRLTRAP